MPEFIRRKHANYEIYKKLLEGFELGQLVSFRREVCSNKWFYSIEIDKERVHASMRDIITLLQQRGIETRAIWGLINEQVPYRDNFSYKLKVAPLYASRILNLPSSTQIKKEEIIYVVSQLKMVLEDFSK